MPGFLASHRLVDLQSKVHELSKYLDNDAIAQALKLTPEAVRDILEGRAEIRQEELSAAGPVIHVGSVKTAYRQKVVAVLHAKGGVGATVVAIGLALSLSKEIKTLLVDFTFRNGGSDLSYYLNLPDYPHMGLFGGTLEECVIDLEPGLSVLQSPRYVNGERGNIDPIIICARQDFDAVVMDLPNEDSDLVYKALGHSNTIIAVTSGLGSELVRLAVVLAGCRQKDIILALNRCSLPAETKETFKSMKTVKLEHDGSLVAVFEKCDLPGEKSIFMRGMRQLKDAMFDREKKGALKALFGS